MKGSQAQERMIAILEALAVARGPLSVAQISKQTGIHLKTCYHPLRSLERLGYVLHGRMEYELVCPDMAGALRRAVARRESA